MFKRNRKYAHLPGLPCKPFKVQDIVRVFNGIYSTLHAHGLKSSKGFALVNDPRASPSPACSPWPSYWLPHTGLYNVMAPGSPAWHLLGQLKLEGAGNLQRPPPSKASASVIAQRWLNAALLQAACMAFPAQNTGAESQGLVLSHPFPGDGTPSP